MRTAPAFLREGQGKKLTFSAIHYSPYSPASHSVLQRFKYAQSSCFPSSIQHYREKKKFLSAAVTQEKNNPFLVNQMRFCFQVRSNIQYAASSVLSVQNVKTPKEVSNEMGCRAARLGIPRAQSPGSAQARHTLGSWCDSSWYCTSWQQLSLHFLTNKPHL